MTEFSVPVITPDMTHDQKMIAWAKHTYRNGLPRGDSTGWRNVDRLYRIGMEQWTLVTGIPFSGKSEWLDALMVNLIEQGDEWGFYVYSPENFPSYTHMIKLAEKVSRQPFNPGPTERMSEETLADVSEMLLERVQWIYPKDKSVVGILNAATQRAYRWKKLGIVLDPWNTFEHLRDKGQTEADYLSESLAHVVSVVQDIGCHIFIVAHPTKLQRGTDGKRPVPTPYDIAGGAHWYNKADNIVCVHRDQGTNGGDVEIHVQKVRRKWLGRSGMAVLNYDRVTGRYSDQSAGCPDDVLF